MEPLAVDIQVRMEDASGTDAEYLVAAAYDELSARYGRPPSPFMPADASPPQGRFVIARLDGAPIGCGALRRVDHSTAEVKRMYVAPSGRRRGIARRILQELEQLAADAGYTRIWLETGIFQPEAICLYERSGYERIAPFGRYVGDPKALCFGKQLISIRSSL